MMWGRQLTEEQVIVNEESECLRQLEKLTEFEIQFNNMTTDIVKTIEKNSITSTTHKRMKSMKTIIDKTQIVFTNLFEKMKTDYQTGLIAYKKELELLNSSFDVDETRELRLSTISMSSVSSVSSKSSVQSNDEISNTQKNKVSKKSAPKKSAPKPKKIIQKRNQFDESLEKRFKKIKEDLGITTSSCFCSPSSYCKSNHCSCRKNQLYCNEDCHCDKTKCSNLHPEQDNDDDDDDDGDYCQKILAPSDFLKAP